MPRTAEDDTELCWTGGEWALQLNGGGALLEWTQLKDVVQCWGWTGSAATQGRWCSVGVGTAEGRWCSVGVETAEGRWFSVRGGHS